jgi:hypothetical protein
MTRLGCQGGGANLLNTKELGNKFKETRKRNFLSCFKIHGEDITLNLFLAKKSFIIAYVKKWRNYMGILN